MLCVPVYRASDGHNGQGVFAREFIPEGAVIWRFDPHTTRVYSVEYYLRHQKALGPTVLRHAYPATICVNGRKTLAVFYDEDEGSYVNHSPVPNMGPCPSSMTDDDRKNTMIALRDIHPGEELTNNYLDYTPDALERLAGIPTCVSFLLRPPVPA